jgi:phosphoribosylformimino-5-aminoimidazole carboxamide ribotide isomerase
MKIIPALDLWNKKVVRFRKGESKSCKVYSDNPLEVAKRWQNKGAEILHLVDLSSALGEGDNLEIIQRILKEVKIKIEVGGGIRDIEKAKKIILWGAERVVIGTKAKEKSFLKEIVDCLGKERVAVSVDVKRGFLSLEGWKKDTLIEIIDFINYLKENGVKWIIYTDILIDGTLEGPNIEEAKKIAQIEGINFILSGGVSCLEDLKKIKKEIPSFWGIILGRCLYEGRIELPEAIRVLEENIDNF